MEDFQGFVAEQMGEPMLGITEVYTVMTPTTERERRDKITNIRLGGTQRNLIGHRNTLVKGVGNSRAHRASLYKKQDSTP